ncbi:MAG: thiamine-phosphate kinase [Candidatus Thorarchaeota archaeon]
MKTNEFGERQFLQMISGLVSRLPGSRLQWNDDASDFPIDENRHVVINVDTFVASTDQLPGMSDAQMGRKLAVMTMSDLVAKGVTPAAVMLSLSVPPEYDQQLAQEIVRGFSQYCIKNSIAFIGGDTGTALDVVLTGVGIGVASPDEIVTRGGARVGDIVAVSGFFGLTSVAFQMLLKGIKVDGSLAQRATIAAYKPVIDFTLVQNLVREHAVTSSMDSSDGLGITLNTMADLSGVAFELDRLPIAGGVSQFAKKHGLDLLSLVLAGGEEFALVLTIPQDKWTKAQEVAKAGIFGLRAIGRVVEGTGVTWQSPDGPITIPATGYDSFREWK